MQWSEDNIGTKPREVGERAMRATVRELGASNGGRQATGTLGAGRNTGTERSQACTCRADTPMSQELPCKLGRSQCCGTLHLRKGRAGSFPEDEVSEWGSRRPGKWDGGGV